MRGNPPPGMLRKKFLCHQLILDTVIKRYTLNVLAIGPQADPAEPTLNALIAAKVLAECGRMMGLEVVQIELRELEQAFDASSRRALRKSLREHLSAPLPTDHRGVLAIAAAVYATDRRLVRA